MKRLILITSIILLTLSIFIACDNGVAFVNDVKPLPKSTDGAGYSTVIFVTAQDKEKIYDPDDPQGRIEPDPELTYTHVPAELPPGVVFTGNLIRVAGEEAGEYDIKQGSLALAGENAAKYTLVFIGAKLTIYEKGVVTIIANNKSKFQNNQDPGFDFYTAPSREALRLSFGITIVGALERTAGEALGDYTISQGTLHLEGPDAGDWKIKFTPGVFHIAKPGEILVKAVSFEKYYGEKDPIFTYVLSPSDLPAGLKITGALDRAPGETAGDYLINIGSLVISENTTGDNYELKFDENLAKLTIKKKTVTVTATSFTRVFNSEFPDLTFTNDLGLPDSAFTGNLECEATSMSNIGVFAITKGTLALSTITDGVGQYVENYDLYFEKGSTLTITNNNIIHVSANPQTKYFDDPDPVLSYTPTEALPAGLSFTGAPTRDPGENVKYDVSENIIGYAIKQGSLALTGTNAEHYTIAFTNSTLTINPKELRVIPLTGQSKFYGEGDPDGYTFTTEPYISESFIETAFGSTKLSRAEGETADTYAITLGNLALQEEGNYSKNYHITFDPSRTFVIKPYPVYVYISYKSKVRDDDDPDFTFKVTPDSLMKVDDWETTIFSGSLTRDAGEAEGEYTIKMRDENDPKRLKLTDDYKVNYEIQYDKTENATLQITPPGPVHISDPVKYMKPIITELHDKYVVNDDSATFRKAPGPLKRDPETGKYPANIVGETFLGSFAYWYDSNDNTVYYYYGGDVYLYGDCHNLFEGCYKYRTMDMTGFNTQYVNNMYQMFFLCYNVKKLDLSGWIFGENFDNGISMANMFDRCEMLEEIKFNEDGVDMSHVTHMGWIFAHNYNMTPTKLRKIIKKWKVKINPNGGDADSNINPLFLSNEKDGGERTPEGANRIVSNDMIADAPDGITKEKIKQYIKDRDIPGSPGYKEAGGPPSKAFGSNVEETTKAYVTKDGISLYLGIHINNARGQRLNRVPNSTRPNP